MAERIWVTSVIDTGPRRRPRLSTTRARAATPGAVYPGRRLRGAGSMQLNHPMRPRIGPPAGAPPTLTFGSTVARGQAGERSGHSVGRRDAQFARWLNLFLACRKDTSSPATGTGRTR